MRMSEWLTVGLCALVAGRAPAAPQGTPAAPSKPAASPAPTDKV